MSWQPIETAPKDRRVWLNLPKGGDMLFGDKYPIQCAGVFSEGVWNATGNRTYDFNEATLWHELPPTPCNCTLSAGDGCQVCNPEMAAEIKADNAADDKARIAELEAALADALELAKMYRKLAKANNDG